MTLADAPMSRRIWLGFSEAAAILGLTIALLVLARIPYFVSPALVSDDLILVPSALANGALDGMASLPVVWWLLDRLFVLSEALRLRGSLRC